MTTSDNTNNNNSGDEKYEVDGEWLKTTLTEMGKQFTKLSETMAELKPKETKSDSNEPQPPTQAPPLAEVKVNQEEVKESQTTNGPRSRLVIRGPKFLKR